MSRASHTFNPHNKPGKSVLLSQFVRWGNWGKKSLPKVTRTLSWTWTMVYVVIRRHRFEGLLWIECYVKLWWCKSWKVLEATVWMVYPWPIWTVEGLSGEVLSCLVPHELYGRGETWFPSLGLPTPSLSGIPHHGRKAPWEESWGSWPGLRKTESLWIEKTCSSSRHPPISPCWVNSPGWGLPSTTSWPWTWQLPLGVEASFSWSVSLYRLSAPWGQGPCPIYIYLHPLAQCLTHSGTNGNVSLEWINECTMREVFLFSGLRLLGFEPWVHT